VADLERSTKADVMRETSVSFGLRDRSKVGAAASMTIAARFWRQKEVIALRIGSPVKSGRKERFAVIARRRSAWRNSEASSEGRVWRAGAFEIARRESSEQVRCVVTWNSKAAVVRIVRPSSNQSSEPTPMLGTSAAEQPLVPSTVVAHL